MRTPQANVVFEQRSKTEYADPLGVLKSLSVSNTGLVIASFYNLHLNYSILRILNITNLPSPQDTEVWPGIGTATSVTPLGNVAAFGFPAQNTVHIYSLDGDGKFDRSSLMTLKGGRSSSSARFGEKVALSENGKSLAVASPGIVRGAINPGAVFVYVWVDKSWEKIESTLYGNSDLQRIGSGGIAINDTNGRMDVRENNGHHRSFEVR